MGLFLTENNAAKKLLGEHSYAIVFADGQEPPQFLSTFCIENILSDIYDRFPEKFETYARAVFKSKEERKEYRFIIPGNHDSNTRMTLLANIANELAKLGFSTDDYYIKSSSMSDGEPSLLYINYWYTKNLTDELNVIVAKTLAEANK